MAMLCKHGKTAFNDCVPCEEGCYYCNNGKVGACDCKPPAPQEPGTVGEWRPIETAPKDETEILLCYDKGFEGEAVFDVGQWWNSSWDWNWPWEPTHWMPLPLPPAPQVKS